MILQPFFLPFLASTASAINLKVSSTGGNASSPLMYGLMFEDINHSGDGEHVDTLSSALPTSINVAPGPLSSNAKIGLLNPGWWGIDVKPQIYTGSFWALCSYKGNFTVKLQSNLTDDVFASTNIASACQSSKWVEHTFELEPDLAAPTINNTFVIEFDPGDGAVNFNLISLFPPTYKNRPNGNHPELMEALKALNPSFLRMPGGNNIEGDIFHYPWRWTETIGPLTQRPGRPGTWGYANTDGLGLVEYLNWCTDLDVEPLLAVWAGMYLGNDPGHILSPEALAPWVDDTLNELEFILGPVSTPYGALRASLGYPEPWALKYVEIGNEDDLYTNGSSTYADYRFSMFYDAITAAYPNLTIISSTGDYTAVGGNGQTATWTDFHIYSRPDTLVSMFDNFDHVSREYKTLIGEYAIVQENLEGQLAGVNWDLPKFPQPVWIGAVSEAIWSIGAERNSDAVVGMSYAPGFQNLNSYNWSPDLVSFTADVSQTVLSTSWHVINLFSNNRYTSTVPVTSDTPIGPAYCVAGTSGEGKYTFKTAIYNTTSTVPFNITFEGVAKGASGLLTVLSAPGGLSANMLDGEGVPTDVVLKREEELLAGSAGEFGFELEQWEVAVFTT